MKTFKLLSAFVFVLALATGFSYGQCCKSASASSCHKTSVKSASAEAPSTTNAVKVAATSETPAPAAKAGASCCAKSQAAACTGAKASTKLTSAQPAEEMVKPVKAMAVGNKEQ